jgi:molecular chaperone GrpE (heat shock protein)
VATQSRWFASDSWSSHNNGQNKEDQTPQALLEQQAQATQKITQLEEEVKRLKEEQLYVLADQENSKNRPQGRG